jgi:hypothetical protein
MGTIIDTAGTYRAKLTSKEWCKSSKGAEQLALAFEVVDGAQVGNHITEFLSFSDAALQYTEKKMRTLGWTGVDLEDLSTLGSAEVDIVVQPEVWEGNERMRVKFINAPGSIGTITPLGDGERKAFAARMRAKIVGLAPSQAKGAQAKKPAPAKTQPQREEPPPPIDADIPF